MSYAVKQRLQSSNYPGSQLVRMSNGKRSYSPRDMSRPPAHRRTRPTPASNSTTSINSSDSPSQRGHARHVPPAPRTSETFSPPPWSSSGPHAPSSSSFAPRGPAPPPSTHVSVRALGVPSDLPFPSLGKQRHSHRSRRHTWRPLTQAEATSKDNGPCGGVWR